MEPSMSPPSSTVVPGNSWKWPYEAHPADIWFLIFLYAKFQNKDPRRTRPVHFSAFLHCPYLEPNPVLGGRGDSEEDKHHPYPLVASSPPAPSMGSLHL